MEVLWVQRKMPASRIYRILQDKIGWKKAQPIRCWVNVLKKALWDVQNRIISAMPCLVGKMYEFVNLYFDGSDIEFLRFFLENTDLTPEELENFQDMLEHTSR